MWYVAILLGSLIWAIGSMCFFGAHIEDELFGLIVKSVVWPFAILVRKLWEV